MTGQTQNKWNYDKGPYYSKQLAKTIVLDKFTYYIKHNNSKSDTTQMNKSTKENK
jgi:hypothetical protein